jgi:hypothetical protein
VNAVGLLLNIGCCVTQNKVNYVVQEAVIVVKVRPVKQII